MTIAGLKDKKAKGEKITMLTCIRLLHRRHDSMKSEWTRFWSGIPWHGRTGYDSTVPVTMDEMVPSLPRGARGVKRAFLIGDLPFMSYNISNQRKRFATPCARSRRRAATR